MESIFKISCLFLLLLVSFHATLLSKRIKESDLFWHIVDYVWLGAATVGLLFATIDVEKMRINSLLDEKRSYARGELNQIRMHASSTAELLHGVLDKDGGHRGIDWFKKLSSELELGFDSFRWGIFLAQNYNDLLRPKPTVEITPSMYINNPLWESYRIDPQNTDPVLLDEAKKDIMRLNELSQTETEIFRIEDRLKNLNLDKRLKLKWPWLLCFALALRMTKVTADMLRLLRNKRTFNVDHQEEQKNTQFELSGNIKPEESDLKDKEASS